MVTVVSSIASYGVRAHLGGAEVHQRRAPWRGQQSQNPTSIPRGSKTGGGLGGRCMGHASVPQRWVRCGRAKTQRVLRASRALLLGRAGRTSGWRRCCYIRCAVVAPAAAPGCRACSFCIRSSRHVAAVVLPAAVFALSRPHPLGPPCRLAGVPVAHAECAVDRCGRVSGLAPAGRCLCWAPSSCAARAAA